MFEKEADEIAVNNAKKKYGLKGSVCMNIQECAYVNGFQDGTEFGYNKANEWHYVKDGKYPTHSYRVLVFTDEGVGFGLYGLDDKKWHTYDTGFEVIAWKELVPPEVK